MKTVPDHVNTATLDGVVEALPGLVERDRDYVATRLAYYAAVVAVAKEMADDAGLNEAEQGFYDHLQDVRIKLAELYGALDDVCTAIELEESEDEADGEDE